MWPQATAQRLHGPVVLWNVPHTFSDLLAMFPSSRSRQLHAIEYCWQAYKSGFQQSV